MSFPSLNLRAWYTPVSPVFFSSFAWSGEQSPAFAISIVFCLRFCFICAIILRVFLKG